MSASSIVTKSCLSLLSVTFQSLGYHIIKCSSTGSTNSKFTYSIAQTQVDAFAQVLVQTPALASVFTLVEHANV